MITEKEGKKNFYQYWGPHVNILFILLVTFANIHTKERNTSPNIGNNKSKHGNNQNLRRPLGWQKQQPKKKRIKADSTKYKPKDNSEDYKLKYQTMQNKEETGKQDRNLKKKTPKKTDSPTATVTVCGQVPHEGGVRHESATTTTTAPTTQTTGLLAEDRLLALWARVTQVRQLSAAAWYVIPSPGCDTTDHPPAASATMTGEERSLAFSSSMMRVATTTNCCSNFSTSPASATTSSCNNPPHICWDNVLMKNHPCIEHCLFHVCCIQFLQQPPHLYSMSSWKTTLV